MSTDTLKSAAAASSSSSAVAKLPVAVVTKAPPTMSMPNYEERLAELMQQERDLAASPPPTGISDEDRAKLVAKSKELKDAREQTHTDWLNNYKKDFFAEYGKLKDKLKKAEDDFDLDAVEAIEKKQKEMRGAAKKAKDEALASKEKALATIEANLQSKIKNAVNQAAVAKHKAKCDAVRREIEEVRARVYDLKRQGFRDDHQRKCKELVSNVKSLFSALSEYNKALEDPKDMVMDQETYDQIGKLTCSAALETSLLLVKRFPVLRKQLGPKQPARTFETVNMVDDDDSSEDEDEEEEDARVAKPPALPPKPRGKGKAQASAKGKKRRAAADGAAAAVLAASGAASPSSRSGSSVSSNKRRAVGSGGRKPMAFSLGDGASSSRGRA